MDTQILSQNQKRPGFKAIFVKIALFLLVLLLGGCEVEVSPLAESFIKVQSLTDLLKRKPDIVVYAGSSIQEAVNKARPGDVIKVYPGVYKEAIEVNKPNLTILGAGRVLIKNPGGQRNGIRVGEDGDGFTLYNVTLRDFGSNGVLMIRADDYVLNRVNTIDCGDYGLFPIASNRGRIEYCVASGHTDSGIYIGQCVDTKMRYNRTFGNVIGLEIENCSQVVAEYNQSYRNTAGLLVVLLPGLQVTVSSDILLRQNLVVNNNLENFALPGGGFETFVPKGTGILVVGADKTTLAQNVVVNNNFLGIAVISTALLGPLANIPPEDLALIEPNPDGTRVLRNVVKNNGSVQPELPVPAGDFFWDGSGTDNCWARNYYHTSFPAVLPSCSGTGSYL
ncbi:parallel beta-helix domain-containing protein [Rufibacter latericius]|uniref:Right handed beta helix domain-containing protein n=1 Tax=Rufibacter latericius TaxID=2487040 RepID=A0A3M9MAN2_9BACT|nr:parallel beta-helix domain-containing protein [Rufibacter latericius]RNI22576.1 hypothetical protein EFB08_20985 [Rufibacter latericius]